MPDFKLERRIRRKHPQAVVAGVDEAGRGPLAGPVFAAAVVLDAATLPAELREGLDNSKKLPAARREELFLLLTTCGAAVIGIGHAEVSEIDSVNILNATFRAMGRAVEAAVARLGRSIEVALVDGNRAPPLPCQVETVVEGDGLSLSIAAASIIAKVTRDRLMRELAAAHPGYGWETNMGYGTEEHRTAIARLGVTPHHRRSFEPVRAYLGVPARQLEFI